MEKKKTKKLDKDKEVSTTRTKVMAVRKALQTMKVRFATVDNLTGFFIDCTKEGYTDEKGILNHKALLNDCALWIGKNREVKQPDIIEIEKLDI